jgi:hypothetical protein
MSTIRKVTGDPGLVWDELSWTDMSTAEQGLWAILGWNEASWEEETDPPASNDSYWEDLSAAQCQAAEQLGYTQKSWDQE